MYVSYCQYPFICWWISVFVPSPSYVTIAAISKDVQVSLGRMQSPFRIWPRVGQLSHMVVLVIVWEMSVLISTVDVMVILPQAMNTSLFSHIFSKICCYWFFFHLIHSHFCLLFKDGYQYRTELKMSIGHFYFFVYKVLFLSWPIYCLVGNFGFSILFFFI